MIALGYNSPWALGSPAHTAWESGIRQSPRETKDSTRESRGLHLGHRRVQGRKGLAADAKAAPSTADALGWRLWGTSFLSTHEIQRLITMRIVIPGGLRQICVPGKAEETDREIAEGGHGLRTATAPDLGSVFVERHIPHPMHLIFDAPMALHEV